MSIFAAPCTPVRERETGEEQLPADGLNTAHSDEEHTCREAGTARTSCPAPAAGLASPSHHRNKQQGGGWSGERAVFIYKRVLSDAPTHVLLKESYSYPVWHSQR